MRSYLHPGRDRFTACDARQQAFDLMVLGPRPPALPRRPHRGMLPDVAAPISAAVRHGPSPALRLIAGLRHALGIAAGRQAAAILLSGAAGVHVGKTDKAAYIGPEEIVS